LDDRIDRFAGKTSWMPGRNQLNDFSREAALWIARRKVVRSARDEPV
jgi:hypothetical protein